MSYSLSSLQQRYPTAHVWAFGDSPELADVLVARVLDGAKRATCSSLSAFTETTPPVLPGSYHVVLDGDGAPACVIRTTALTLVRFCDVTPEQAAQEGEGDLSLAYWRAAHQDFFTRSGDFSPEMELVMETFTLVEALA